MIAVIYVMKKSDIIDKITEYADLAHGSPMRKYSEESYIVHPVRVMIKRPGYS